jgi:hypothetical protein
MREVRDEDGGLIGQTRSAFFAAHLLKAAQEQREHETKGADDGSGITLETRKEG